MPIGDFEVKALQLVERQSLKREERFSVADSR
jgi:hypothetical protein